MGRPVIGIVVWRRGLGTPLGDPEILHALSHAYVAAFSDGGMTPLLIPNGRPMDEVEVFLDRIDGLALSGGGDVDPASYGAPNEHAYDTAVDVDTWERALIVEARRRRMPLLAICRGIQILNVAHGGTLDQEILEAGTIHEPLSGKTGNEMLATNHPVHLVEGGDLHHIYGTTDLTVNTIHHQAIDTLGDGLEVEGTAPDGIVEAVRSSDPEWWCVGVQWHPERNDDRDEALFAAFAVAAS